MANIGKRLYYNKETGYVFFVRGEQSGDIPVFTPDEERNLYTKIQERVLGTYDSIDLEYGQYAQDFRDCNGYRVNTETKELEFSYPDPNAPEAEPVYRPPLSEEVESLKQSIAELTMMMATPTV